ncbi:MAG: hypothetical protein EBT20_03435 [Alphaproteobacteria bacterium]|nr:hypothetical protein [Alphaproteobacteria bacterium]
MPPGYIDIYCERLAPGLFDEPLNAISNGAFILAGYLFYIRHQPATKDIWAQSVLMGLVGVCSLSFHTTAHLGAMFADIASIMMFIFYHVYLASLRFIPQYGAKGAFGLAIIMVALSMVIPPAWAYGSMGYAPALMALVLFGMLCHGKNRAASSMFLWAATVFLISLLLRTIDRPACDVIPLGTHYFWHVLNAVVLYLTAKAVYHGRQL